MGGRLFRKYVLTIVLVVCSALVINGLIDIWFSYQEQRRLLVRIQQGQASFAAESIHQYFHEIESQMAWITSLPWTLHDREQWRLDAVRLMRQAPAISELTQLDARGHEQFQMARQRYDVVSGNRDYSHNPAFVAAMIHKAYYGPVYYVAGSEPYLTLAFAGARPENGVTIGQVNLKFIWDVVSQIKVGRHGTAYVVNSNRG